MPLRFTGNQLLQTASNQVLAGASSASFSIWIRINPGCNVTNANGTTFFGDGAGRLSLILSGSGKLVIQWSPNGQSNQLGGSSYTMLVLPGTSYHLAATWQDGLQRYFVNGQIVAIDHQRGALGALPGVSGPFRLGSDSAGTDLSIDEPTLWLGYILTDADVSKLRDRLIQPAAVSPNTAAIRWSLVGPDGVQVRPGDGGLKDGSASGLNLNSILGSSPNYVGSGLSYTPPQTKAPIKVSPSGQLIVISCMDNSGNAAGVQSLRSLDDIQALKISAIPNGGAFSLTFGGQTTVSIPVVSVPPPNSCAWNLTGLTPGAVCSIALNYPVTSGSTLLVRVFDGPSDANLLGAPVPLDQGNTVADFVEDGFKYFQVGDFTPTGTNLTVRVVGTGSQNYTQGSIRFTQGGQTTHFGSGSSALTLARTGHSYQQLLAKDTYDNAYLVSEPDQTGYSVAIPGGATVIQSALLNLAGGVIPAGGIQVTGTDSYLIRFVGPLAGEEQPALTSSDPAIIIYHDDTNGSFVGGQYPSIQVDGATIPLHAELWTVGDSLVAYPLPSGQSISTGQTVTFNAPNGYISTAAGPLPPLSAAPVVNFAGNMPGFLGISTGPKMNIGYNVEGPTGYSPNRPYCDVSRNIQFDDPSQFVAFDSNHYPTKMVNPVASLILAHSGFDFGGANRGPNGYPQGRYLWLWDGKSTLSPIVYGVSDIDVSTGTVLPPPDGGWPGVAENKVVYDIRESVNFSPLMNLKITTTATSTGPGTYQADPDGTYPCDFRNLRIIMPNSSDPSGNTIGDESVRYYPISMDQLGPAACIRTMDPLATNANNVIHFEQFPPQSYGCYRDPTENLIANITRVEAYTGSDKFLAPPGSGITLIQFTTSAPHGFADGQIARFFNVGNAETATQSIGLSGLNALVRVLSPTTFAVNCPVNGLPMTNVLTPTAAQATVTVAVGGMTLQDCLDLPYIKGCDSWINVPTLADDDCVRKMAQLCVARLRPGFRLHVEYSNEPWNYNFQAFFYFCGMSSSVLNAGYSWVPYYVYRAAQIHAIFVEAFVAAGVPSSRLRRVMATNPWPDGTMSIISASKGDPVVVGSTTTVVDLVNGTTTQTADGVKTIIATYPPTGTIAIDELATGSYVPNDLFGTTPGFKAVTDTFNSGQILDLLAMKMASNKVRDALAAHAAVIAAAGLSPSPDLVLYECGWDTLLPFLAEQASLTSIPDQGPKIHAVQYHPDMRFVTQALFAQWRDAGVKLANIFYLNSENTIASWNSYFGHSMLAGNGLEPGASNITDPTDIPNVRSIVGGAVNLWMSALQQAIPKRLKPGGSARPRAAGYRAW